MKRNDFIKVSTALGASLLAVPQSVVARTRKIIKDLQPKIVRNDEGKTINVIGDMQTFKLTGEDTNGMFTLIEEENEPGTGIPPHVHQNEDEVFKVVEGEMELTVGGKTTILKAGDLAFGPRGVPHSWRIVGDTKAKVILSVFPAGIEHMFEELGDLPPGPPDFPKVAEICGRYGINFIA
ncbi:MAG: quercetin 2,3-dioxygenase [Croceitalea sp.]|nr:quercetin 2,3-dioxygenase [Croceitalea sp.]MBT8238682.1 quercetin 2,3-dioxygenase [Croceitalea sp.]NNL09008.1 quercetin 2,3-dioxygenase [Croceitalea sp.]NNM19120.1 quercetin 2,3-dioxygenase [Croceitalea sp.]